MIREFELIREKTALVIVDMQNDFVRPDGAMCVPEAYATIAPIQKLLKFARENQMPVVFTKFLSGSVPTYLWNWSPETEATKNCRRNYERFYPDLNAMRQCADVIDELKPILPEDFVVEKYNYSAFRNTFLQDALASEGRDTIIVTGTVTQICVQDTVHDAFALGIKALVASDCVSTFSPIQQQACLENFRHKYGMVMTSDEIIAAYQA